MREVERKYRANRGLVLPDLTGRIPAVASIDPPVTHRLVAVYYDTADLRLAREGITLRRRSGGDDDGWHLKLPLGRAGNGVREEIQVSGEGDAPPDQLRRMVTAYIRFAATQPAATLVTERKATILRGEDGAPLAELVDDQVTVQGLGRVSAGFRELEIEDRGGWWRSPGRRRCRARAKPERSAASSCRSWCGRWVRGRPPHRTRRLPSRLATRPGGRRAHRLPPD